MTLKALLLISLCITNLLSYSQENKIELSLTHKNGYGPFQSALGGISPYSEDANNPWKKTYLKVSGVPKNWVDIKFGDIETNIYQSVYQNYLLGNITKVRYEELQKSWDWIPDSLNLSKKPLKCKIAFAFGKDSTGLVKMVIDANNNLNFSDDKIFKPFDPNTNKSINKDSVALANSINISFESFIGNKKAIINTQIFIAYMSEYNMFMCNFPQYLTATYKGAVIAVCSDNFTNLSYKNPTIALIKNSSISGEKVNSENIVSKNEYIEIKGEIYKNNGINQNRNSLILEKVDLPKSQLLSTQVGYKSFLFEGDNFKTKSLISLESLKGKYVLLDFWAVWCGPCRQEMPNLKGLYNKIDKSKFEIIGIVGDSPSNALDKSIDDLLITWPQILSTDINKIKEKYGIHGYPTTFLLNPEGIIIAKNLRGKELDDKIKSLIKE